MEELFPHLLGGFHGELQADCFRDSIQRGQPRIAIGRQHTIETFALNPGSPRDLGYTPCLRDRDVRFKVVVFLPLANWRSQVLLTS